MPESRSDQLLTSSRSPGPSLTSPAGGRVSERRRRLSETRPNFVRPVCFTNVKRRPDVVNELQSDRKIFTDVLVCLSVPPNKCLICSRSERQKNPKRFEPAIQKLNNTIFVLIECALINLLKQLATTAVFLAVVEGRGRGGCPFKWAYN